LNDEEFAKRAPAPEKKQFYLSIGLPVFAILLYLLIFV